jgi:glycosyltransferase involved in cell wall biosynthesis
MNIAIWHNLPSGGGKRALYHHVKGLVERGHTVETWCPPTADRTYLPLSEFGAEHIVPMEWEPTTFGQRLRRVPGPYHFAMRKMEAMLKHCQECARQINAGGFDVLFANSCLMYRTAPIGRFVKIPTVLYLQEPFRLLYEAFPELPWPALPAARHQWTPQALRRSLNDLMCVQALRVQAREELQSARAFGSILVNSYFSRESLRRAYGLDSKVCYLGLDTDLFHPTDTPKKRFVIGLGGIAPAKGLETAIRAVAAIETGKRPPLVWIGNFSDGEYQKKVETLARDLGVVFEPKTRVADSELVELLSQASVMIYPPRLEPFGFAPLEANACGTPVVAISEGGVRETVKPGVNGFLADDDDPACLGATLLRLLDHPDLVCELGKKGRQYVIENWTWDKAVIGLERRLQEEILRKGAAHA